MVACEADWLGGGCGQAMLEYEIGNCEPRRVVHYASHPLHPAIGCRVV